MRAVVQRVRRASVEVGGRETGRIEHGLLVLLGIARGDGVDDISWLVSKLIGLRIFPDADGRMNRSVIETGGGMLIVSQFTLLASTRKGTRPSFNDAAPPDEARPLHDDFLRACELTLARPVARGEFGAAMQVSLVNDGPVTLVIDSRARE